MMSQRLRSKENYRAIFDSHIWNRCMADSEFNRCYEMGILEQCDRHLIRILPPAYSIDGEPANISAEIADEGGA